jgi:DNA-binding GntR family transcriptional regulator
VVKLFGPAEQGDVFDLPTLQPVPTAAERAADVIRENIFEGRFVPGMALREAALSKALQVSRNTIREAFRSLTADRLLMYEAHRGVMVRWLTVDDVRDVYRLRRMFEVPALDLAAKGVHEINVDAIDTLVTKAEREAEAERWSDVGTLNLQFHVEIVNAHRSPRTDEVFHRLMAEMRLGFLAFTDPATLHRPFVSRNRTLHEYMADGRLSEASDELGAYLDDAEELIVKAVRDSSEVPRS